MRILSLSVENFRCIRRGTLDFRGADGQPRPLTVLVGRNMSGKTTWLDALHLAHAVVENAEAPRIRPELDPADPLLRPDPNASIVVRVELALDEGERAAIEDVEARLGSPAFRLPAAGRYEVSVAWPPGSATGVVSGKTPAEADHAFRGRGRARIAVDRRVAGEAFLDRIGGVVYLDQHRSVDLPGPTMRTGTAAELRDRAGSRDVLPWLEFVSRAHQKWDPATQGESAWDRVRRLYADLAAPARIDDVLPTDVGFDLRLRGPQGPYYSSGMSGGERQILRLVANLVSQRASHSVVLIDELELHLHPAWQRNLLHFCRSGGGAANQFIVTTHSESVLRYVDRDDVHVLSALDDGAG